MTRWAPVAVALLLSTAQGSVARQFVPIPPLPGDTQTSVRAVSGDGSTIVGTSGEFPNERAFFWTEATGIVPLPFEGASSSAVEVSYDGSVIVGETDSGGVRWVDGVIDALEGTPEYPLFLPAAVSADGNVIAGRALPPAGPFGIAAQWTEDGLTDLGELAPDTFPLFATDISDDGAVIVGLSEPEGFRWTEATGMVGLGFLPGFMDFSIAECVSADGSVIGGQANIAFEDGYLATWWTEDTGWVAIPSIIPSASVADAVTAINQDGTLMAGRNTGFDPAARQLFLWDPMRGPRPLQETLESEYGVDFLGWQLADLPSPFNNEGDVVDMSNDGGSIVGVTINPDTGTRWGWLVRTAVCAADLDDSGEVGFTDLVLVLSGWGGPDGDVTGDGTTDFSDLLEVLVAWGPC